MSEILFADRAQQIISLVNGHSPICRKIGLADIVRDDDYSTIVIGATVVACIRIKRMSWYQTELSHLVVAPEFRRQGYGRRMVAIACEQAAAAESRLAQCTIRCDNIASKRLFQNAGFQSFVTFNGLGGKAVGLWQKVL